MAHEKKPRFTYNRLNHRLDVLVKGRLWLQVILAMMFGVGVGLLLGPDLALVTREKADLIGGWLGLPGNLFLALIRMVIIPLAASSIILGIAGTGGGDALRAIGRKLIVYVLLTTVAATMIGVTLSRFIRPGRSLEEGLPLPPSLKPDDLQLAVPAPSPLEGITRELPDMITSLIPQNITASLMEQDMLAIVVFSLFVGIAMVSADKKELTRPLVALTEAMLEVSMTVIRTAMRFAPLAVFGLMAETISANGIGTLVDLATYCGIVLTGLACLLVMYLVIVTIFGRMNPVAFVRAVAPVQLLAFSTSSSAAVMPLTMKTAIDKLKTPASLAGAVVPLASTVNMAGTALYQSVAILFLAQISGVELSLAETLLLVGTLVASSIGAPGTPGVSIAILASVAAGFGIPAAGLAIILGVDRILDMSRTVVNVTGDITAAVLMKKALVGAGLAEPSAAAGIAAGDSRGEQTS